jgi:thymidylate kinase
MDIEKIIRFAQSLDESGESVDRLYEFLLAQFELERPEERDFQNNGVLITFDGHSGAGKDKQMELLEEHMQKEPIYQNKDIVQLVQKRENPFRQVPKYLWAHPELQSDRDCSLLLLTAGRKYFTYHKLLPLLENPNVVVLQNRSYLSHVAYHAQNAEELPHLLSLAEFDPQAGLPFVLHCDVEAAFERVIRRSPEKGGVVYQNERPDYTLRVKRNFESLGNLVADLIFIDTSGEIDAISKGIKDKVDQYFRGKT